MICTDNCAIFPPMPVNLATCAPDKEVALSTNAASVAPSFPRVLQVTLATSSITAVYSHNVPDDNVHTFPELVVTTVTLSICWPPGIAKS